MSTKIRPIRDLYFRLIQGTDYDGHLSPQDLASMLNIAGIIILVPHKTDPIFTHYRDVNNGLEDLSLSEIIRRVHGGKEDGLT